MPTYEFRCPKGHEFERFYKTISAGVSELPCPECGAVATRQLSGGGGLVFKGSGFYLTDYGKNAHRSSVPRTSEKADAKADKATDVKADAKSNAKSDARSDAKAGKRADNAKGESRAESREPKAESREPKAESSKPKPKPGKE